MPPTLSIPLTVEYSRGKEPSSDAIPGRMHATGFFREYHLYCLFHDLRVAQLNNRNDFSPCFLRRKDIPCFFVHPPLNISQTKSVCVLERISVCALTRIYITCTTTNYVDVPELPHPLEAGDVATRCCVAFSGAVIVITTSSF